MTDYYRTKPATKPFLNIKGDHPYLHDIIEVESTNQGVPFSAENYNGIPWAKKCKFMVIATHPVCYNGYRGGSMGSGSFHSGIGNNKRRLA